LYWQNQPWDRLKPALLIEPFETSVPLEVAGFPSGLYTVDVNGQQAKFTFDMDNEPFH